MKIPPVRVLISGIVLLCILTLSVVVHRYYTSTIIDVMDVCNNTRYENDMKYGPPISIIPIQPTIMYNNPHRFFANYDEISGRTTVVSIGSEVMNTHNCHFDNVNTWIGRFGLKNISEPNSSSNRVIKWNNWNGYEILILRPAPGIDSDKEDLSLVIKRVGNVH